MSESALLCPSCGEITITNLGRLRIANGVIRLSDPGNLYQCSTCGLLFRHPYLSPSDLARAYAELPSDVWACNEDRADFALAADAIQSTLPSGDILDVGCYCGDFLMTLPGNYRKYGMEPAQSAREIAQQRGITLVGSSIEQIEISRPMFHIITFLDVIEHLPYPLASLRRLVHLLLPGGILIVSTGNTDAVPWRLMRHDYWYYFSEHVSFFNPGWFRWAARQLALNLVLVKSFSHFEGSTFERWRQFARCLAFWMEKHAGRYQLLGPVMHQVYPFGRVKQWASPPDTRLWQDQMLVVLKAAS